ncbi:hypothetical protein NEUTE2DRAFT_127977 [Neurospora tetrasperma FGSC 2509]|nr:hypothetical protein NEUTE2DRAFT_127977 [Neurospora tetrasperma FGSC 2509]
MVFTKPACLIPSWVSESRLPKHENRRRAFVTNERRPASRLVASCPFDIDNRDAAYHDGDEIISKTRRIKGDLHSVSKPELEEKKERNHKSGPAGTGTADPLPNDELDSTQQPLSHPCHPNRMNERRWSGPAGPQAGGRAGVERDE